MTKVIFCIPGNSFSGQFFNCWSSLLKELPSMGIEWDFIRNYHPNIYRVRDHIMNRAINLEYDYMMWIDSDVIFSTHDFDRLLKSDRDIVSGIYFIKNGNGLEHIPTEYACVKMDGSPLTTFDKVSGLTQVRANGMGFMLIKNGVFESIQEPFNLTSNQIISEDICFQNKALHRGYKSFINPDVVLGHEKLMILR